MTCAKRKLLPGFAGPVIIFAGIMTAIYINRSWWNLTAHAISDLGHVGLPYNYVLNVPIIVGGALILLAAFFLQREMNTVITRAGMYMFLLSTVFLVLIGVFPEGTQFHGFVSHAFFYIGSISMVIVGTGCLWERDFSRHAAYAIICVVVTGTVLAVAALAYFPGVAVAEFIAAVSISTSYYIVLWEKYRC